MTPLRQHVYKIIDDMPEGTEFTTEDICRKIVYKFNSLGSVALAIRMRPDVENLSKKGLAKWRKC